MASLAVILNTEAGASAALTMADSRVVSVDSLDAGRWHLMIDLRIDRSEAGSVWVFTSLLYSQPGSFTRPILGVTGLHGAPEFPDLSAAFVCDKCEIEFLRLMA